MTIECQYCHRPEPGHCELVSRHTTSEGVVAYIRCACGRLYRHQISTATLRSWYRPENPEPTPAPDRTPAPSAA